MPPLSEIFCREKFWCFTKDGIVSHTEHCNKQKQHTCIFEYIYFARPDSVIDKVSVYGARVETGKILAKEHPVDADIVIGVPDSGLRPLWDMLNSLAFLMELDL